MSEVTLRECFTRPHSSELQSRTSVQQSGKQYVAKTVHFICGCSSRPQECDSWLFAYNLYAAKKFRTQEKIVQNKCANTGNIECIKKTSCFRKVRILAILCQRKQKKNVKRSLISSECQPAVTSHFTYTLKADMDMSLEDVHRRPGKHDYTSPCHTYQQPQPGATSQQTIISTL